MRAATAVRTMPAVYVNGSGQRMWRMIAQAIRWIALVGFLAAAVAPANAAQSTFASPEEAAEALVKAARAHDSNALVAVLGPAREWLSTGDRVMDRANADRFVEQYTAKHSIAQEGDKATLLIGNDDYPFAFPIVRQGSAWRFDTEAGKEQLLARRIGENELDAMQVLRAIVDAQLEYASADRNGDGVLEYARKLVSTPGRHDGLYWPTKEGEPPSPLGPLVVQASKEGYTKAKSGPTPYHGYLYRMLKGQGPGGGAASFDFVVRGRAIGGFAVLAYPARYGNTGIMSFVVNHEGKLWQADLGKNTASVGASMQRFDPGKGWTLVAEKP